MEQTQASQLTENLAQKGLESPFFLARGLLGFDRLTPHFHYEMCEIARLADQHKRLLVLVPRDHYKSTIFSITYPLWRGLRNSKETGLIVANTKDNAATFLNKIKNRVESPLIQNLYNARPSRSQWGSREASLEGAQDGEATWTAAGWKTRVTSQHFDYIIFDDLVDEETYQNPELMAQLIDKFEQKEGLLKPPIQDRVIIVVMNHWCGFDLACHIIEKRPEFHVYYRQAIEGGRPLFPEAYTMKWLRARAAAHPFNFATQWMNDPTDESLAENKPEDLQQYKRGDNSVVIGNNGTSEEVPLTKMHIYIAADPRHSIEAKNEAKLTSRNAFLVGGVDPSGRFFALEEYAKQSKPEEFLDALLAAWKKWSPLGAIKIGVESYGFQNALASLARIIWKDEPSKPRIEELPRDTRHTKTTRIRGGYRVFAEGKGYTHKTLPCFNTEYRTFDSGRFKDLGDCWAWFVHMAREPESLHTRRMERDIDRQYARSLVGRSKI